MWHIEGGASELEVMPPITGESLKQEATELFLVETEVNYRGPDLTRGCHKMKFQGFLLRNLNPFKNVKL